MVILKVRLDLPAFCSRFEDAVLLRLSVPVTGLALRPDARFSTPWCRRR